MGLGAVLRSAFESVIQLTSISYNYKSRAPPAPPAQFCPYGDSMISAECIFSQSAPASRRGLKCIFSQVASWPIFGWRRANFRKPGQTNTPRLVCRVCNRIDRAMQQLTPNLLHKQTCGPQALRARNQRGRRRKRAVFSKAGFHSCCRERGRATSWLTSWSEYSQ